MEVWGGLLPATGTWLAVRFDSDCSLTLVLDLEGNPPTLAAPSKGCTWVPRAPTRAHSAQALRLEWGTSSPAKEQAGPNPRPLPLRGGGSDGTRPSGAGFHPFLLHRRHIPFRVKRGAGLAEVRPGRSVWPPLGWGPRRVTGLAGIRDPSHQRREPEWACPICSSFALPSLQAEALTLYLGHVPRRHRGTGRGVMLNHPPSTRLGLLMDGASCQGHLNAKATDGGRGVCWMYQEN